jgi:hypothetical protein
MTGDDRSIDALCDALFVQVLDNDVIDLGLSLRLPIRFDYTLEQTARCFDLCAALWRRGTDRQRIIDLTRKILSGGKITEAMIEEFKHFRARFKHLRFAFAVFGARHRYPPFVDLFTSVMGNLQDAFKNHQLRDMAIQGRAQLLLLCRPIFALANREIARFQPADRASFARYMRAQIAKIDAFLRQESVTAHEFHEARKVISRFRGCYGTLVVAFPSPEHDQIAAFIATINGLMGNFHDVLIERKIRSEMDYKKDRFTLQNDIRERLDMLMACTRLDQKAHIV